MSHASGAAPQQTSEGLFSWIGRLFSLKTDQFHPVLGLIIVAIMVVPLLALEAVGHEELWLSLSFGILFTGLSDAVVRGDTYRTRVRWSATVVLVGALLTALGYLLGGANWGLVALAVFVTTLLSYLAAAYGQRGALAGVLLNVWFVVALSVTFALDKSPAQAWPLAGPQAAAWLAGGVLWMLVAGAFWLVRRTRARTPARGQGLGQQRQPTSAATPAQDATPAAHFSRPLVAFAALAALAVALATSVAWGFDLPNAAWMPVATVIAMKPHFDASAYRAGQRVAGALVGAILSAILLTLVHDRTALEVIIVVVAALGAALHEVNYALYSAGIATAVLIALGLPHPENLTDNWERVAWTLVGVVIALMVTALAGVVTHDRVRVPRRASTA